MCGRYTLTAPDPAAVRARFPIGEAVVRRRYNVAPADPVLAVTTDRDGSPRGELLRWGLVPSWSPGPGSMPSMINARIETVTERPAFRGAVQRFRCLIVADGFYEWQQVPGTRRRRAFHITRDDGGLFAFAGLWSIWHGEGGDTVRSCTILTRPANQAIAALHDRMPVILAADEEPAWLDPATPQPLLPELLGGLPAGRTALRAVGPAVNDARHDAPDCLLAPEPDAQGALF